MDVVCASCGETFVGKRPTAKFCSNKCRQRAADVRKRTGNVVHLAPTAPVAESTRTDIADSVLTRFAPDVIASPAGQVALRVATDIDHMAPGMPGYASLIRELRTTITELEASSAPRKTNPLVLLRERHASERASG